MYIINIIYECYKDCDKLTIRAIQRDKYKRGICQRDIKYHQSSNPNQVIQIPDIRIENQSISLST
jgi:hypothetical protein